MSSSRDNPFPGMNPYLEAHWNDVHPRLIIYASSQLQSQMPSSLVVRVEQDIRVGEEGDAIHIRPDIGIAPDRPSWSSDNAAQLTGGAMVAEPILLKWPRPVPRWLGIRDEANRLVTAIELLSPANKIGRDAIQYQLKRNKLIEAGVNLVEIDLVRRGGLGVKLFDEARIAEDFGWSRLPPYAVTVMARDDQENFSFYPIWLKDRLPAFRVPLRLDEEPAILDLQPLINQCYIEGAYWRTDYTQPPSPPLRDDDAAWADEWLRSAGLR